MFYLGLNSDNFYLVYSSYKQRPQTSEEEGSEDDTSGGGEGCSASKSYVGLSTTGKITVYLTNAVSPESSLRSDFVVGLSGGVLEVDSIL